jgi:hypothetical protein
MAVVKIKPGAQPRLLDLMAAVGNVAANLGAPPEVWITSGMDSLHSPNSLHYALRAIDIRTKNFPTAGSKRAFMAALQAELGPDYDVILEYEGQPQEHIHAEADPA